MMNHRMPSVMSGNLNGPPLSVAGMNSNSGPMMDSGVPMMHPGPYGLANMIPPHGGPHLHERELLLGSGMPGGAMGPGPHGVMQHISPHMMHQHHPHHGHPGMQMYGRPSNPYMNSTDNRINEFNRRLQQRTEECDNIWWDTFITEFFEEDATLTITFTDEGPKRYTMGRTLIPRYFRSIFESGCTEYYYFLRSVRESFHTSSIVVDSESAQMVMTFPRTMPPTTITVEGRLVLDFTVDELMRIRNWNFQIRSHREFVLRSMPGFACNQDVQQIRDLFSINLTRCGIPNHTMNFFRICTILEPMQELMSRQKAYSLSPKDCLKTTLFQKWQRMVAPPGQQQKSESNRQTNKRRKRKGSSANSDTASGRSSKRKQSPVPSLPNLNLPGDVMIVGEPTLMGGELGEDDERSITRLENTQYDTNGNNLPPGSMMSSQQQQQQHHSVQSSHLPNMSVPHMAGLTQSTGPTNNSSNQGGYQGPSMTLPSASIASGAPQVSSMDHQMTAFNGGSDKSLPGINDASQLSSHNGSLSNLLKSDSRLQYPGTCSTPGSKTNSQDQGSDEQLQQQQQQQCYRPSSCSSNNSKLGSGSGPPRPTSQGANQIPSSVTAFQDAVFGFTTDNLCEFNDKIGDIVTEQERPISEPLPLISGPVNSDSGTSKGSA